MCRGWILSFTIYDCDRIWTNNKYVTDFVDNIGL